MQNNTEINLYQWYFKVYELVTSIASKEGASTNTDPSKGIRLLCEKLNSLTTKPKDFRKIYLSMVLNTFIIIRNHLEHRPKQQLPRIVYFSVIGEILPHFEECVTSLYPDLVDKLPIIMNFIKQEISKDAKKQTK